MNENLINKGLVICEDGRVRPVWATTSDLLRTYYDNEWGRPLMTEREAFERLSLECFQAGLSWETVLKKRDAFRKAFADFDVDTVAEFNDADITRLLENPAIIRNGNKIRATINNAKATQKLREHGGLIAFLASFAPTTWKRPASLATAKTQSEESTAMSKALKKHGFKFVGPTTCFALMEATGLIDNRVVGASDLEWAV
ncbi:DNA-3-methyladenine glycosylase I [Corynebacterium sp. H130]|uniref:DNA-3-methyladenine glycosylase I n=1 Tax=Corynebacterium sp. H130 TaxID=3133444 RepID=UPI0030AFE48E